MAEKLILTEVKLIWRNFAGAKRKYNAEGERSFNVLMEDEALAERLIDEGWAVKVRPPYEEGDAPSWVLDVSFGNNPARFPNVFVLSNRQKTRLGPDEVSMLDYASIESADVAINAYDWEVNGASGRKAYLNSLYATLEYDPLADKYASYEVDTAEYTD